MAYICKTGVEFDTAVAWVNAQSILGVDTETNGLDPFKNQVLLVQIGTSERDYVFDVAGLGKDIYRTFDCLSNTSIVKIFHNAQFDYKMLKQNFKIEINNIRCTMIMEQLLNAGKKFVDSTDEEESGARKKKKVSAGLGAVTDKYLGMKLDKSEQKSFIGLPLGTKFTTSQLEYAGDDIKPLIPLHKVLQKILIERGMEELNDLEQETIHVLGDMTLHGIYLDINKWGPLEDKAQEDLIPARKKLNTYFQKHIDEKTTYDLFGPRPFEINYNSPVQVLALLREATKIDLESTDAKYLEEFKNMHPAINDLVLYRQLEKKISTYGRVFFENIEPSTGRIHSTFKQLHAQTGRLASERPKNNHWDFIW